MKWSPFFFLSLYKRRRAVSELVAAILLLAITLVGFGLYFSYASTQFKMSRTALTEELYLGIGRAGQQLSLIEVSPVTSSPIFLYIYNYGPTPYNVTEIKVKTANQTISLPIANLTFSDPVTGNPLGNTVIAPSTLTRINFTITDVPLSLTLNSKILLGGEYFFGRTYTWEVG